MTSQRPYWCPKTMKRRPCWCPKPILWELYSFLMRTLSFVPINLHRCWPREWKHSIATMTFSHVKITCYFQMLRYQVFARKLNWYFIGVYIIKIVCLLIIHSFTFHWKNKFVVHKLQIGPTETFQKIHVWESELISKG